MDYMKELPAVARQLYGKSHSVDLPYDIIGELWQMFEALAKSVKYEILEDPSHALRLYMAELTGLLYRAVQSHTDVLDVMQLVRKDKDYGGSWHRRGGPGAFMMLARKYDRIALAVDKHGTLANAVRSDSREDGILDDIADLRCYLLLCQSWHAAVDHAGV